MEYSILEVWDEFDLELSLKASFSLPLFIEFNSKSYIKFYGFKSGLKFKIDGGRTLFSGCDLSEALILSGAWFNPFEHVKNLSGSERSLAYRLMDVFPGLGIAIDPWDVKAMFYSIFLSRNTDYHNNTVRWLRKILSKAVDEDGLKFVDPMDFDNSYQLKQLSKVKDSLHSIFNDFNFGLNFLHSIKVYSDLKRKLLSISYVGSKSVHALGLFCFGLTSIAPVDRHLTFIIESLGLFDDFIMPRKTLCLKYDCLVKMGSCPINDKCLMMFLMRRFGVMAGWIQTATYLYGSLYLSRNMDPAGIIKR
ncbi:MAG: hypothetical protein QXI93_05720 [Candidatus Methanomethylicia archaeon]